MTPEEKKPDADPAAKLGSLRQAAANSARWNLLGTIARQLITLGVTMVLARLLGPASFGMLALASVWLAFLELFVNQGLGMAIIQRSQLEDADLDTVFWSAMAFAGALTGLTWLLSGHIAEWMHEPQLSWILRALSASLIISSLSATHVAIMTRSLKFRELALRTTLATLFGGALATVAAFAGWGVWALVVQQLGSGFASVVVLWKTSPWRPRMRFSWERLGALRSFSTTVLFNNILSFISARADQLLIGKVLGSENLGIYSNAKRLPQLINDVLRAPVTSVALPMLARLQNDESRLASSTLSAHRIVLSVTIPVFAFVACFAPEVMLLMFGKAWLPAAPVLRLFAIAQVFSAWSALAYPLLMAIGRAKRCLLLQVIHSTGTLLSALLGVQYGAIGVAYGLLANVILVVFTSLYFMAQVPALSMRAFFMGGLPPLAASFVTAALTLLARHGLSTFMPALVASGVAAILSVPLFLLVIFSIAPNYARELMLTAREFIRRKRG